MKCPFETPVETKEDNIAGFNIVDKNGDFVQWHTTKKKADYIVQAINSHEKLVKSTKALVKDRDILQKDEGIFACQCLAKAPDDITEPPPCCYCQGKQALSEAE